MKLYGEEQAEAYRRIAELEEALRNLVAVCDDLEENRVGRGRMAGYWLNRSRIDPLRALLRPKGTGS